MGVGFFCGKNGQFSTLSTGFSTRFAENFEKKRENAGFLREKVVENTGERVEKQFPWGKYVESCCPEGCGGKTVGRFSALPYRTKKEFFV
ncbi:MAG: hypothetical protein SOV54_07140 [Faecalibacterium prausnitzii]|nr:hypothetical protein [Faecalibacterium prausnitzii]MDY2682495.1 hypothetical protein [Faecalibacterium prausnitzii]